MDNYPTQPTKEQVEQWIEDTVEDNYIGIKDVGDLVIKAVQWGADQELEACCEWLADVGDLENQLRRERRPPQLSLKEQALEALREVDGYAVDQLSAYVIHGDLKKHVETIRRALEALPEE